MTETTGDPRRSVTVPVSPAEAFRIYTQCPAEWLPPEHTFISGPEAVIMEPRAGGRFYERGADGAEVTRGTIVEWADWLIYAIFSSVLAGQFFPSHDKTANLLSILAVFGQQEMT